MVIDITGSVEGIHASIYWKQDQTKLDICEMKWALVVKGWACKVLGGQVVGLQGPMRSTGGPTGSQGVKGFQGVMGFQEVMGYAKRVPRGQGMGLEGPKGSRGRPNSTVPGDQGVGLQGPRGLTVFSPAYFGVSGI